MVGIIVPRRWKCFYGIWNSTSKLPIPRRLRWWTSLAVITWTDMKKELKWQFLPTNSSWQAREMLRRLRQDGIVRDYVKNFTSLLFDIKGMSDEDKVFNFVAGLQPWAQAELLRQGVKEFQSTLTVADGLVDMLLDKADHGGNKYKKANKGHAGNGQEMDKQIADGGQKSKLQSKAGSDYFICNGPHFAKDCPKK